MILFALGLAGLTPFLLWGLAGLRPVGQYPGPYGDIINTIATPQRNVTDVVTAVNFDYRGFDTLGEEFILFGSVAGVSLLLRRHPDERKEQRPEEAPTRQVPRPSAAVRVMSAALVPPTVLFGLYVVTHGTLTPGGGFQGGVIVVSALLLVYLAGDFARLKRLVAHRLIEGGEALGGGGFALLGVGTVMAGGTFLQNLLPLGTTGDVLSGGTIWLISVLTGLEVCAGLFLVFHSFLEDTLEHYRDEEGDG
jgi:multicomponent Na+:H+ antiporter subunit B